MLERECGLTGRDCKHGRPLYPQSPRVVWSKRPRSHATLVTVAGSTHCPLILAFFGVGPLVTIPFGRCIVRRGRVQSPAISRSTGHFPAWFELRRCHFGPSLSRVHVSIQYCKDRMDDRRTDSATSKGHRQYPTGNCQRVGCEGTVKAQVCPPLDNAEQCSAQRFAYGKHDNKAVAGRTIGTTCETSLCGAMGATLPIWQMPTWRTRLGVCWPHCGLRIDHDARTS